MKPSARSKARVHALQAIYQWQMTHSAASEIEADFLNGHLHADTDRAYFHELLRDVISHHAELDQAFSPFLNIPLADLDPIELAILRIGTHELTKRPDVPWRVIINEALELAKKFASVEGFRFINGVLDPLARKLRPDETALPKES